MAWFGHVLVFELVAENREQGGLSSRSDLDHLTTPCSESDVDLSRPAGVRVIVRHVIPTENQGAEAR